MILKVGHLPPIKLEQPFQDCILGNLFLILIQTPFPDLSTVSTEGTTLCSGIAGSTS